MRVRSGEAGDFDAVTSLLEQLGRAQVTEAVRERCRELFEAQLADADADHLVAENGLGAVVGVCSLHFRDRLNYPTPQAWVPDLFVAPHERRAGIGRMLLEEAERRAAARDCWEVTLESGYQRAEAHQLYRRLGMRDAGKFFRKLLA